MANDPHCSCGAHEASELPALGPQRLSRRTLVRGAMALGGAVALGGFDLLRSPSVHAVVPNPGIFNCDQWGARPPGSLTEIGSNPNKILVHHTATGNQTDYSQDAAFRLARAIQNYHMDHNGWSDTGQHFTVSRGGYSMEGRHYSLGHLDGGSGMVIGAHCPGQNDSSIGIENEGTYTSESPTDALWLELIDLCAYICQQYGIPSGEIYGHRDFWSTACPGDTLYGMLPSLRTAVQEKLDGVPPPPPPPPAWQEVIGNTSSNFTASANWGTSSWNDQKLGDDYRFANPEPVSDGAYYRSELPADGTYRVEAWYPSNSGYNPTAPYVIFSSSGNQVVHVDQRSNGGQWVSLGDYAFAAGYRSVVAVSRWSGNGGYVIADGVRLTLL